MNSKKAMGVAIVIGALVAVGVGLIAPSIAKLIPVEAIVAATGFGLFCAGLAMGRRI